jgi:hypothetical protein
MALSHDVHVWKPAVRKNRRCGYGVRWLVAGGECSGWFTTHALADNHRSGILQAMRRGDAFDTQTGLPESPFREQRSVTWFDLACRFVDLKWPHLAAKSRMSIADALAAVPGSYFHSPRISPVGGRPARLPPGRRPLCARHSDPRASPYRYPCRSALAGALARQLRAVRAHRAAFRFGRGLTIGAAKIWPRIWLLSVSADRHSDTDGGELT